MVSTDPRYKLVPTPESEWGCPKDHEIKYLRFLSDELYEACGPANDDIVDMINQDWKEKYGALPAGYFDGEEPE